MTIVRSNRGVLTRNILLYNDKVLRWTMDSGRGILSDSNNSVVCTLLLRPIDCFTSCLVLYQAFSHHLY